MPATLITSNLALNSAWDNIRETKPAFADSYNSVKSLIQKSINMAKRRCI